MIILKDRYHERRFKTSAIKLALLWIRQMQQHVYLMPHQEKSSKKYSISICAIFKDEAPYLAEWLDHHLKIGIEHFYMYDNNSSDKYMEKLDPYIKKGQVTLISWPEKQKQLDAYEDCIRKFSGESKWIGFIDLDEFVMLREDVCSIREVLEDFPKEFPAVFLNWKNFGSSGLKNRDLAGSVVKDFTQCREYFSLSGKVFFNTLYEFRRELQKTSFHHCLYTEYHGKKYSPVNVFGKPVFRLADQLADHEFPATWINHYRIKSLDEFISNRMQKGDVFYEQNPHSLDYFKAHDRFHTSTVDAEYAKRMEFIKKKYLPKKGIFSRLKCFVKKVTGLGKKHYLTDEENDRRDTCYRFPDRIAVYTCIIGAYDAVYEPVVFPENIDYYIVTDMDVPAGSRWRKIDVGQFREIEGLTSAEKNRYFKMHPHLLFPEYSYSIYIDGNIKIISDFSEHMNRMSQLGFSTFKHHRRRSVYEEIEACIALHKAPVQELLSYQKKLRNVGFPEDYGLAVCNLIVREHHKPRCIKIMEEWWKEYFQEVHRDQVALPLVLKNNNIKMDEVTVLGINEYKDPSFMILHHKSPSEHRS